MEIPYLFSFVKVFYSSGEFWACFFALENLSVICLVWLVDEGSSEFLLRLINFFPTKNAATPAAAIAADVIKVFFFIDSVSEKSAIVMPQN